MDGPPGLTEAMIEKMRAIGLRLDRTGMFWHEGTQVTHPRLRQALLRWLDVRDDGRDVVRLDDKRYAYVEIEDAHLRARSARWDGDRCFVLWDDDRETELDYGSLRQAPDHALYVRVHDRLRGRIAGPAYHAVAERIIELPATRDARATDGATTAGDGFALEAADRRWPIKDAA
ncbi:MAG TPA: hypothetical protein VH165_29520 [Kofleriaceae bacterium]|nr:hypothetical protein [Kofleriaceae bacterium]